MDFQQLARSMYASQAPRTARVACWKTYHKFLTLSRTTSPPNRFIFLNIGCGLGDVTRQAVSDGIAPNCTLSVDKDKPAWIVAEALAKETGDFTQLPWAQGNLLDERFLPSLRGHASKAPVDLFSVTSLSALEGKTSAIFAERLFHCLPFSDQETLARRLVPLLSKRKGSMIFGRDHGLEEPGVDKEDDFEIFYQSRESWRQLWTNAFKIHDEQKNLEFEVELKSSASWHHDHDLWWSITRV